ncbi:MAG: hypothetical protein QXH12_05465 [Candidatus Caldarchaeum sp.]|uniref:Uncharacterized protein n=1 Tax=Caldiarchaeum subterraneum TaxID=311458 RepID=A0A7C5LD66_CALS0
MDVVVYSTEWTGDIALGEALINLLVRRLKERSVAFKLLEKQGLSDKDDIIPWVVGKPAKVLEVVVDERDRVVAEALLDDVYRDGTAIKQEALKTARKYITDENELNEYAKGLEETYGW